MMIYSLVVQILAISSFILSINISNWMSSLKDALNKGKL
jgi:hypothetical protein